jgi:hypothetical protein
LFSISFYFVLLFLSRYSIDFLQEILFRDVDSDRSRFFSFTLCFDEVTVVMNTRSSFHEHFVGEQTTSDTRAHTKLWTALQVSAGSAGSSGASVYAISRTLAKNNVALYFLGTFGSDFVLVREEQTADATRVLQQMNVLT